MKRVLVTGANGHVGLGLVRLLAERGYQVRASVRDKNDPRKTMDLRDRGVEVVEADVMRPDTLAAAADGMDGVFQVAAVYKVHARDPEREIVEPSVVGGINVLKAAKDAGVKKVVFTSSVAAVGSDAPPDKPLTEDDWNDGAVNPYFIAKTRAERKAWAFAREHGLNLVVMNPCAVIGPGFRRHTPSTQSLEVILRGRMPLVLPAGFCYVDVRDVARAHLLAYENEKAAGRYIVADRFFTMLELMPLIKELEPAAKVPTREVPRALLGCVAPFDWLGHKLLGLPRLVTRSMIRELGGKHQRVSSAKARRELGWEPMDFKRSLADTLAWIRKTFIDAPPEA